MDVRPIILEFMSTMNPGVPLERFDVHDLFDAGLLDSLGLVDLACHLERTCGIRVDAAEAVMANFRSVDAIARFVERKARTE